MNETPTMTSERIMTTAPTTFPRRVDGRPGQQHGADGHPGAASNTVIRTLDLADTDATGRHHNSVIMRWVEACEAGLWKKHGLIDVFPCAPRVQHLINYVAPMSFDEHVSVSVGVASVGRTSMTFFFEVTSLSEGRHGSVVAHGTFTVVNMPDGSEHPQPWSERVRTALLG
ncbi:acyl-CoA thioesterase [Arthrobacter globiformis]|uniref:acyl-CoA thioesterase n=1 Tax=Arthrobacter globiformis TaxID=1665 RepID=UPI0027D83A6D|nr:hotdog domain-containing protein [Arthrobacter globiformis]